MFLSLSQKKVMKRKAPSRKIRDVFHPRCKFAYAKCIGLDLSLNSPGWVSVNAETKVLHFYWLRQRVKEKANFDVLVDNAASPFYAWTLRGTALETPDDLTPLGSTELYNRFTRVIGCVSGTLTPGTHVIFEAPAYGATQQSSQRCLMELGGCLRLGLSSAGFTFSEVAPNSAKKIFCGKGKAKKTHMHNAWLNDWHLPDLRLLLNIGDKTKDIPHPVQDLVDALAVALSAKVSVTTIE